MRGATPQQKTNKRCGKLISNALKKKCSHFEPFPPRTYLVFRSFRGETLTSPLGPISLNSLHIYTLHNYNRQKNLEKINLISEIINC